MSNVTEDARPTRTRRRLTVRLVTPVVVAAAAAGLIVGLDFGSAATAPVPTAPAHAAEVDGNGSANRIETASYSLEKVAGTVRVTIFQKGELVQSKELQEDLTKFGIPSRIFNVDSACPNSGSALESATVSQMVRTLHADKKGNRVIEVAPSHIPYGKHLAIVFGAKQGSEMEWGVGVADLKSPQCVASLPKISGSVAVHIGGDLGK
ncbi:hypothetical protein [Streptomyces sp. NPDC088748]|uniref:hypothetical protein n=1 Tax=Streptomyces sp. NPDC088748 TaxID=3365887 RepID=UPI0038306E6A